MRATLFLVLGVLPLLPAMTARAAATTAPASAPREVAIARGWKAPQPAPASAPALARSRSFHNPYYSHYTSPYYHHGGFVSPYAPRWPTYRRFHSGVTPLGQLHRFKTPHFGGISRFNHKRFDHKRFDHHRFDHGRFGHDRFDHGRFGHDRFDRFHRPHSSPRIHVPRVRPRVGVDDRFHFRGSGSFRGGTTFRGGSSFRGGSTFRGGGASGMIGGHSASRGAPIGRR